MNNKIKVLYKKTGKPPVVKTIKDINKIKKMIVQNDLQMIRFENCIIVCEKRKQNSNFVPNIVMNFGNIAGDFFLIGYNPKIKDFRSLKLDEIYFYSNSLMNKSFHYNKKWLQRHYSKEVNRKLKILNKSNQENTDTSQPNISLELISNNENPSNTEITQKSNNDKDLMEIILNIQAVILNYVKKKNERRITLNNRELKKLVHEIYVQYRYLFQSSRKEITHFTRNGIAQEWTKNKYEIKEK